MMKNSPATNIVIRPEQAGDESAIDHVNDTAFGTTKESKLVRLLRQRGQLIVSLVAVSDGKIIGHVAFSPVTLDEQLVDGGAGLAPVAVLPEFQKCGVGTQLCTEGLAKLKALRWRWVVVVGHPTYYPRFGFTKASTLGLKNEYGVDDPFMALELTPGALAARGGLVQFAPAFAEVLGA